ncbi:hypothetical protein H0G86_012663 [Trichoderma simmonsii]|uniref:Uncharacterized protein n=1 Tax=Trichoderma simmonsii TaxID=1491479 RepID=A0A8G0PKH9_9HYPO|nr:hypothetical protein H0G86_012663 [Trichoderma simmonsii]
MASNPKKTSGQTHRLLRKTIKREKKRNDDEDEGVIEKEKNKKTRVLTGGCESCSRIVSGQSRAMELQLLHWFVVHGLAEASKAAGSAGSAPLSSARSGGIEAVDWRDAGCKG